jgi:hypothetical protein
MDEQYLVDIKVKTIGVDSATKKIKDLETEMSKLEKTSESYKQKQIEVGRVQSAAGQSNNALGKSVSSAKDSIGGLNNSLSSSSALMGGLAGAGLLAATALFTVAKEVVAIEKEFTKLNKTVARTSGLVGTNLDKATASISALSKVFGKETNEINKSAASFAKVTGISYTESLSLIEDALLNGADANGDFLDKLREYPVQFKNAGFSAEEFIKVTSQEVAGGTYADKLLDSVKEADISLKEQSKSTRDALVNAFGATFTDDILNRIKIGQLTTKNALLEINELSKKVSLTEQQRGQLTADIFKGAGEDAGGFVKVLEELEKAQRLNLKSLDDLGVAQKQALVLQQELATESVRLADNFEGLSSSLDNIATSIQTNTLKAFNSLFEAIFRTDTLIKSINKQKADISTEKNTETIEEELIAATAQLEKFKDKAKDLQVDLDLKVEASRGGSSRGVDVGGTLRDIESNDKLIAAQQTLVDGIQGRWQKRGQEIIEELQTDSEKKDKEDKRTPKPTPTIRVKFDFKKEFDLLRKSFEDNFEVARLEAQKQFAAGLITETELQQKLRSINEQEAQVLITITANKKESAKTGEEDLEISKQTLVILESQKAALDAQLESRRRLLDLQNTATKAESAISTGENEIALNNEIQQSIRDNTLKTEEEKQKALEAIKLKYANIERRNRLEFLTKERGDAQLALVEAQKNADAQASIGNDGSTEEGLKSIKDLIDAKLNLLGVDVEISKNQTEQVQADSDANVTRTKTLEDRAEQAQEIAGYINQVTDLFKQAVQADIAAIDEKLSVQESRISAGVELAKMGNDELLNQELERQDKLLNEKEKLQKKENALNAIQVATNVAASALQAAANIAVAITKAAAQSGVAAPVGIATTLGAIGIGLGATAGLISGFFAEGVIDFKGKGTGTSDSNIVAISSGESVITAKGTQNASKMLTMINEGKLKDSDYLSSGLNLEMVEESGGMIDIRTELNEQISISRDLLTEMQNFEKKVTFSAKGVTEYVRTKDKITNKLNTR